VPSPPVEQRVPALSPRAIVVGLVCVAITCVVVCYAELVVGKIQIGFLQLPPVVVGMLVLLLAAQALLGRLRGSWRLRPHELFTVFVMMLLASMVSSRGLLEKLIPLLIVPNYYAGDNGWQRLFFTHIPRWLVPWDPEGPPKQLTALRFYEALRAGEAIPWQAWIVPLLAWSVFVALMFGAFLCMAVLLRRQWVDNEKLSFPLVQLPLEMVRDGGGEAFGRSGVQGRGGFMRDPRTWMGFALPALVFGFNGLHQWYPSIPEFTVDFDLNALAVEPPWNAMLYFHAFLSFAAIGFFFLLPTDLLFSLWFFFLLTKVADVWARSLGYEPEVMPMYGERLFLGYQIIGCYAVIAFYTFWTARPHLRRVWRAATARLRAPAGDEDEVLSYRAAFWGLFACLLLSAGWLALTGMSYWLALFELAVLLFLIALVMARSTAESGMLMTETCFRPVDIYRMAADVRSLGPANLTSMAFLDAAWLRDQRGLILTGFLDAMKGADGVRIRRRSLLGVFVLAIIVAIAVAGYLHIALPYRLGAVQMYSYVYHGNPLWAFNDATTVLNGGRGPLPWWAPVNFVIGVIATVGIAVARARLMWFPLHPLGYALCGSWTMMVFWFPCLVAWLLKGLILRYGGMPLFARARPFFLGMVLGEFTMAVLWTIPSLFWRTPTPAFPWP
jgi:hypothetical protein